MPKYFVKNKSHFILEKINLNFLKVRAKSFFDNKTPTNDYKSTNCK